MRFTEKKFNLSLLYLIVSAFSSYMSKFISQFTIVEKKMQREFYDEKA